jgi:hypothetical protein
MIHALEVLYPAIEAHFEDGHRDEEEYYDTTAFNDMFFRPQKTMTS